MHDNHREVFGFQCRAYEIKARQTRKKLSGRSRGYQKSRIYANNWRQVKPRKNPENVKTQQTKSTKGIKKWKIKIKLVFLFICVYIYSVCRNSYKMLLMVKEIYLYVEPAVKTVPHKYLNRKILKLKGGKDRVASFHLLCLYCSNDLLITFSSVEVEKHTDTQRHILRYAYLYRANSNLLNTGN